MIDHIKGFIDRVDENVLVVVAGGIGYAAVCSALCVSELGDSDNEVTIYTYLSVSDNGITLYGFSDTYERNMFLKLISVSKVGPKVALSILSVYRPDELCLIISANDIKAMSLPAGVGKKLAENIILNLKDKLTASSFAFSDESGVSPEVSVKTETVNALVDLGFNRADAFAAVNKAYSPEINEESLLRLALMSLAN